MTVRIISRAPDGSGWLSWTQPREVLSTDRLDDIPDVLARVEQAARDGHHAAGFLSYEAGPAFDDRFVARPPSGEWPLAWFAVFDRASPYTPHLTRKQPAISWRPDLSLRTYRKAICRILEHIAKGDTYQINFAFALNATWAADLHDWFFAHYERQPTPYALLIETPAFQIASLTPELFFRRTGDHIECQPMKGTCPRAPHPDLDREVGQQLHASDKNRAENLMITDMVRNDLGRIAIPGSVQVHDLFRVKAWPTLWQMTSGVSARSGSSLAEIFAALFPCASITGAPKLKASEIIATLEPHPRGPYTGALGWCRPGGEAEFAVAIRTATLLHASKAVSYGVGSGIVWDSEPDAEHRECLLKARILKGPNPESLRLLETMRWDPDAGYVLLEEHLDRMEGSAAFFGFTFDRDAIRQRLQGHVRPQCRDPLRIRLLLHRSGKTAITGTILPPHDFCTEPTNAPTMQATIDARRIDPENPLLYHKTTRRAVYNRARRENPGVDEVLLVNTGREAMEFTNGNIVVRRNGAWITPPLSCGLLPGVMRRSLLACGRITEEVIPASSLGPDSELYLINSVRGWRRVCLVPRQSG